MHTLPCDERLRNQSRSVVNAKQWAQMLRNTKDQRPWPSCFTGKHSYLRGREGGGDGMGMWEQGETRPRKNQRLSCESLGKAKRPRPWNKQKGAFLLKQGIDFHGPPPAEQWVNCIYLAGGGTKGEEGVPHPIILPPQAESQCSAKWFKTAPSSTCDWQQCKTIITAL